MFVLRAIFRFLGQHWQFFAGVAVLAVVGGTLLTCQNRGDTIKVQQAQLAEKNRLLKKQAARVDSLLTVSQNLTIERDTCRNEQRRAEDNFQKARVDYDKKVADFRKKVASMTPEQKQAAMLDIATRIVTRVQTVTITAPGDTTLTKPLGTINLAGKDFPYYTAEQQDLLLWALGEGEILADQRQTTDVAAAVLPVLREAMYNRITAILDAEIDQKHFLGIGQKKALKKLREDINEIFRQYLPLPKTKPTVYKSRVTQDPDESELEHELNRKVHPRRRVIAGQAA